MSEPQKPTERPDADRRKNILLRITGGLAIAAGLYRLIAFNDHNVRMYFFMGVFLITMPYLSNLKSS